jgi:hypothetical protein
MPSLSAAETASIIATIASVFDQSLPLKRPSSTKTADSYGHDTTPLVSAGTVDGLIKNPTASQLQLYAGVIGSQRAMMFEALSTTDIREGDYIDYSGSSWEVHGVQSVGSYSWTNDYLLVTVK